MFFQFITMGVTVFLSIFVLILLILKFFSALYITILPSHHISPMSFALLLSIVVPFSLASCTHCLFPFANALRLHFSQVYFSKKRLAY